MELQPLTKISNFASLFPQMRAPHPYFNLYLLALSNRSPKLHYFVVGPAHQPHLLALGKDRKRERGSREEDEGSRVRDESPSSTGGRVGAWLESFFVCLNPQNGMRAQVTTLIMLLSLRKVKCASFTTTPLLDIRGFLLVNSNKELVNHFTEELWAMKLGLRLLQERAKPDSFWWPYIANLTETFTVPIFFPGEDIKNLQYAPLLHQVNKRCHFLLEFEKEVQQKLDSMSLEDHPFYGQDVNSSSLGWAMSAASSRAFRLHGDIPMLLPLIDMCNHSFNPNARIVQEGSVDSSDMSVKVVAEKKIEQNAAITLNYGCHPNDLFLLDYGFVITPNPYDQVELSYDGTLLDAASMAAGVSSPNFSTPALWQQDILSQLNLHGEGAILKVSLGGPDIVDGRLLAALRVILADDPEAVRKHDLKTLMSLDAQVPLGPAVEASALRTVLALCAIALQHFHTKITDDEAILRGGPPLTTELAVQFRLQKKFLIVDVMQNISRRIKMLSPQKSTA